MTRETFNRLKAALDEAYDHAAGKNLLHEWVNSGAGLICRKCHQYRADLPREGRARYECHGAK